MTLDHGQQLSRALLSWTTNKKSYNKTDGCENALMKESERGKLIAGRVDKLFIRK